MRPSSNFVFLSKWTLEKNVNLFRKPIFILCFLCSATPVQSASIVLDGVEWRTFSDGFSASWSDASGICAQDGITSCNGSLNGIDLNGWIWATRTQVNVLLKNSYSLDFNNGFTEVNSIWAPSIVNDFGVTHSNPSGDRVTFALTSSLYSPTQVMTIFIEDSALITEADFARNINPEPIDRELSLWLFKDTSSTIVPEPSALWLLTFGLIGFLGAKKRTSKISVPYFN